MLEVAPADAVEARPRRHQHRRRGALLDRLVAVDAALAQAREEPGPCGARGSVGDPARIRAFAVMPSAAQRRLPRPRTARWRSWTGRRRARGRRSGTRSAGRRTRPASGGGRPRRPRRSARRRRPASASCRPTARAKWPRWFVANCISQRSGVRRRSRIAITPALLTSRCSGPLQAAANAATESWSARSSGATATTAPPVVAAMSAAVRSPGGRVADRERDLGAGARERPRGLDADARRAARDDRAAPGEVDARDDLRGGRLEAEGGGDRRGRRHRALLEGRGGGSGTGEQLRFDEES